MFTRASADHETGLSMIRVGFKTLPDDVGSGNPWD